jgi:hypothetical protein
VFLKWINFMSLLWTFSMVLMEQELLGAQMTVAYSIIGLTSEI